MAILSELNTTAIRLSPYTFGLAAFVLFAVIALVYRAFLPKPIPGIPYKKSSANNVLGDAPDVSYRRY